MPKFYKVIADNRQAFFNYNLLETFSAGIVLSGAEVKSLRLGRVVLRDAFGRVENGEIFLYNMNVATYEKGSKTLQSEESRKRKLLLNKSEQKKIIGRVSEKGLTIVPIKLYFSGNWAKVDIALAKAKKKYEKRETIRQKEADREVEKILKGKR